MGSQHLHEVPKRSSSSTSTHHTGGMASQPKCPACKKAPASSAHKCPSCLTRAYCSAACLEGGKRLHRKECAKLAFETFEKCCGTVTALCRLMTAQGRYEDVHAHFEPLLRMGETGLGYKVPDLEVRQAWTGNQASEWSGPSG